MPFMCVIHDFRMLSSQSTLQQQTQQQQQMQQRKRKAAAELVPSISITEIKRARVAPTTAAATKPSANFAQVFAFVGLINNRFV